MPKPAPNSIGFTLPSLKCLRCGRGDMAQPTTAKGTVNKPWYPRDNKLPETCPTCKSPYWNTPRKEEPPHETNLG